MSILTLLQNHANLVKSTNPVLVVLKGFPENFFESIIDYKLFDSKLNITIQELESQKATLLPQIFTKNNPKEFYWCTYEELMLIGKDILQLYYTIVTLRNNLFDRCYPALYGLGLDNEVISALNADEPEYDDNGDEQISLVYRYYGSVRELDGRLFVTYPDVNENELSFYTKSLSLKEVVVGDHEDIHLELSENEDDFLKMEIAIIENRLPKGNIFVAVTGDLNVLPYQYASRLQLLQALYETQYTFYLVRKQTNVKTEINETEYISVLQRYWGYTEFRTLKMYKNIQNQTGDKETIEISQAQIIDDIVQEALKAKLGSDYRDVFVTSPTGAGKSIMFQVPAIYLAEQHGLMTIVISPLIGLMNDQVQSLRNNHVNMSATINSEISPVEKMEIRNKIQEGQISILYISPETLLSRSDITQLIGDRQVGLFVIDEAHIVTTWGKAFRSDYWYLGTYLSRLRKEKNFPIATFTATAIYGGIEDMYVETRDSLNMISPISYFGYVRRDNLEIHIQKKLDYEKRFKEYLMDKNKILLNRLERFVQEGQKTLVYFPTVKAIIEFREFSRVYGSELIKSNITFYYGPLDKEIKQENYLRFKNNDAQIMLATKAFGMGIDIPDIRNVYHFAPTGNVCDYVQEIGRAARALDKGFAYFDFLPPDFVHVQRLHGISTIKKGQLLQVIRKILSILDEQEGKHVRNLLVSADEFRYIFQEDNISRDNDDFDNKIKTALLIIEKDFQAKMTYSPIIARPRSIFANEYFMVPYDAENKIFPKYKKYFTRQIVFGNGLGKQTIYRVDMKGIWQDKFQNVSFAEFKYHYHNNNTENRINLPFRDLITPVMQIQLHLKTKNVIEFKNQVMKWADRINTIMGRYAKSKEFFYVNDLANYLQKLLGGTKYTAEMMASIIIDSCITYDKLMRKRNNFYNRFITFNESRQKYRLLSSGYSGFTDWLIQETNRLFQQHMIQQVNDQEYNIYFSKLLGNDQEKRYIYLGLMESLGLLLYRVNGGDNPEIFIRVNTRLQLEQVVNNPSRYRNLILENVHKRYKLSVEMLRYIFENEMETSRFWDLIEDYFLGIVPDEILQKVI